MSRSCPKAGIKIHETPSTITKLDLDLSNYSFNDLCDLFKISDRKLTHESMKNAKKITLMTHPDKSGASPEVFLFYSNAYKMLYGMYEFSNTDTLLQKSH